MKAPQRCAECGRTFFRGAWMWMTQTRIPTVTVSMNGDVRRGSTMHEVWLMSVHVQITVRPRGSMVEEVVVGEIEIVNDETGDDEVGNYTYVLQTYDMRPGANEVLVSGRIEGVLRTRSTLHVLRHVLDKEMNEL
jgi:hypothetical protein